VPDKKEDPQKEAEAPPKAPEAKKDDRDETIVELKKRADELELQLKQAKEAGASAAKDGEIARASESSVNALYEQLKIVRGEIKSLSKPRRRWLPGILG
jgi:hypothetical protein